MEPVRNITDSKGYINSIYPAGAYLTFGPWIFMVPQYVPKSVLMLGYAGGTTAGLIKKFYGDSVPITAVDVNFVEDPYNVNFVKADAKEYIKTCEPFDSVIVDVFDDGALVPCDFVFTKEFADNLKKKANYIILHVNEDSDMSAYDGTHLIKVLALNDSRFYYYMVNEIPSLPVR